MILHCTIPDEAPGNEIAINSVPKPDHSQRVFALADSLFCTLDAGGHASKMAYPTEAHFCRMETQLRPTGSGEWWIFRGIAVASKMLPLAIQIIADGRRGLPSAEKHLWRTLTAILPW